MSSAERSPHIRLEDAHPKIAKMRELANYGGADYWTRQADFWEGLVEQLEAALKALQHHGRGPGLCRCEECSAVGDEYVDRLTSTPASAPAIDSAPDTRGDVPEGNDGVAGAEESSPAKGNMGGVLHQERADHLRRAAESSPAISRHGRGCGCTPCKAEDWDVIDAGLAERSPANDPLGLDQADADLAAGRVRPASEIFTELGLDEDPAIRRDSVEQHKVTPEDEDRVVKAALEREDSAPASRRDG